MPIGTGAKGSTFKPLDTLARSVATKGPPRRGGPGDASYVRNDATADFGRKPAKESSGLNGGGGGGGKYCRLGVGATLIVTVPV